MEEAVVELTANWGASSRERPLDLIADRLPKHLKYFWVELTIGENTDV